MGTSLDKLPRASLAHLPTPLERLPRLSDALGVDLWVKRDDCTGLAGGGNKARKLELLLGAALEEGADTVLTVGGLQSNHARQTAAAAAQLGLRCELVLPRVVPRAGTDYEESGNLLLDRLLGAEVFIVADEAEAAVCIQQRLEAAAREGRRIVVHPPGGSTPLGAAAYVAAARELVGQRETGALPFGRSYVAVGSGGTLAGLSAGNAEQTFTRELVGVCVARDRAAQGPEVDALTRELCEWLDLPSATPSLTLDDAFLGEGYGIPSPGALEAISLCARLEGLLLDPVYTGKAMAALIAHAREGRLAEGPVLFWHTGGAPGLFAYRNELRPSEPPVS